MDNHPKVDFVAAAKGHGLLNERQLDILGLIAEGLTNGEIAESLDMTLDGAKWNVSEILTKLGLRSRDDAAAYYRWHRNPLRRARRQVRVLAFGAAGAAVAIAVVSLLALGFLRGSDPDDTGEMTDPALDNLEVLVITILDPGLRVLELPSGRDSIFAQARVVENLKWSLAYEHMLVQFADRPGQYAIVEYLTGRTSVFSFDESDSNPRWAI